MAVILLSVWAIDNKVTQTSMEQLIPLIGILLPINHIFPATYHQFLKLLTPLLNQCITYDCCPNHCHVYKSSVEKECPVCKLSRYLPNSTKTPRSRFTYIPIIPRLKKLLSDVEYSKLCKYPFERTSTPELVCDVHDGDIWKRFVKNGYLTNEDTIGMALNTDGVSLWGRFSNNYSVMPMYPNRS